MHLHLGCIADDLTGGSDLGLMLARHGLPVTLFLGAPDASADVSTGAAVIALKIRTAPAKVAVRQAREAAEWLLDRGAAQLFYKYCSTFDSTPAGNIGPVSDALLRRVGDDVTVLVPSFPANGRTVRDGHLLVDGVPLSESSMRHHPLTPMTDSFLPNLMDSQTEAGSTGIVPRLVVAQGPDAIANAIDAHRAAGRRYIAIDASTDDDLVAVAAATRNLRLLTGASGIGGAIPGALRNAGHLDSEVTPIDLPRLPGHAAVLAGSCSAATRDQVSSFRTRSTAITVDPIAIAEDPQSVERIAHSAVRAAERGDVMVYSSADPGVLRSVQSRLGADTAAALVEDALGRIARCLSESGISKFIAAGGETSGTVAESLGMKEFSVAQQIDPGVPWLVTTEPKTACIAFKSGNFGRQNFFQHALGMLP